MKKPGLLRAALTAIMPEMARDPDRLAMWVERGQIRSSGNRQHGFAMEYDLIVYAENYTHDPSALFFAVVDWLRTQQPDLLLANGPGFPFEVDVIDDKTSDVQVTLPLRENVTATDQGGGQWQLDVLDQAAPLLPDDQPLCQQGITAISVTSGGQTTPVAP